MRNTWTAERHALTAHRPVNRRVFEDDEYANDIQALVRGRGICISSLAFYPNTMDANLGKRQASIDHLKCVIRASAKLGVNMVTTFIGRDQRLNVDENIELFRQIWPGLIELAEKLAECGVLAYPLEYMAPKIPGRGDVNWGAFISALDDIRYDGCGVIEVEDKAFEGSREDILKSIRLSR